MLTRLPATHGEAVGPRRARTPHRVRCLHGTLFVVLVACSTRKPAPPPEPPPPAPTTSPAQSVVAVVVANGCAQLGKANAKLAESAMSQLVDGCGGFKGSPVRFTAQLLADGSIFFQPGAGHAQSIPVCVLEHPLRHKVKLTGSCALDVQLEQSTIQVPRLGDAGP
jgi:hypothetical protein